MTKAKKKNSVLDGLAATSRKMAQNIYVKSLQSGFASLVPAMILTSVGTLLSAFIFNDGGICAGFLSAEILANIRGIATSIANGTTQMLSILTAISISYYFQKNKNFDNPLGAFTTAFILMIILMPLTNPVTIGEVSGEVRNMLSFTYTGSSGLIVAILVGLFGTDLFIRFSGNDKLKIKMPAGVPEATAKSFNVVIPTILVGFIFGILGLIFRLFGTSAYGFIAAVIQAPLGKIATNPIGFAVIQMLGNLAFAFGIHSSVFTSVTMPFTMANYAENTAALAAGTQIPHIISDAFLNYTNRIGGSGCVLALVIAILIVSRRKDSRDMAKIGGIPALFNIGEPMIFGAPIIFNPLLAIPFVLSTGVAIGISYILTAIGFIQPLAVYTPSTTPVIMSGFLASGGDLKVVFTQILILAVCVLLYIPFVKLNDKAAAAEEAGEEAEESRNA